VSRRGAKPKPTRLKALEGTLRSDRRNPNEPETKPAIPRCPTHLGSEAKREWRRLAPQLARLGLLSKIDREALALFCQAWARWVEAEEALKRYGVMVKSPNGFPMQSPYLAVANKAMEQMRALLAEFGMSPSSRTRVHATPQIDEDDPMEQLLRESEPAWQPRQWAR
jgi:P27 family predicted phage terminase small subunit